MSDIKTKNGTQATAKAARQFSRRALLRNAAAFGAASATAPLYVKNAFAATSGEVNVLCWTQELPENVLQSFTEKTGITVKKTPFSSNEEQINKMQATFGEGFDLCMPSFNRASEFEFIEVLKPFDEDKLDLSRYQPSILKASTDLWTWDGLYHVPHLWGAEGMAWKNDTGLTYADSSYGLLWEPEYAGRVQMRPVSALLGLGLWLDATGEVPSNRMLDTYESEEAMRAVYDKLLAFAVEHKSQVKQFWDSTDSIRSGFRENGCDLGQTWDGPIKLMIKEDQPMSFMAPKEGCLTWMDGFALSAAARNTEEVYALLDYLTTPEVAGAVSAGTSYNPVVAGADEFIPEIDKKIFRDSYPEDSLDKLWWYPASPVWFNPIRNEYAERWKVA